MQLMRVVDLVPVVDCSSDRAESKYLMRQKCSKARNKDFEMSLPSELREDRLGTIQKLRKLTSEIFKARNKKIKISAPTPWYEQSVGTNFSPSGKSLLGRGGGGKVYLSAMRVHSNNASFPGLEKTGVIVPVAVKVSKVPRSTVDKRCRNELRALSEASDKPHPHLQKMWGVSDEGHIVTPIAVTDLANYFKASSQQTISEKRNDSSAKGMPTIELMKLIAQAGYGLEHLHCLGWLHLDIKAENILISHAGDAVLSDFGGNTPETVKKDGYIGLVYPEPWEKISQKSDVFGLAALLFEMLTGERLAFCPGEVSRNELLEALDPSKLSNTLNARLEHDTDTARIHEVGRQRFVSAMLQALECNVDKRSSLGCFLEEINHFKGRLGHKKTVRFADSVLKQAEK
ncbi:hypothetical protein PflCFBP13517_25530 [Pseudomonas fluorescens]|nr:hypothetical protein PflCFBP13517_25530 [Pseudomonas fluorescens]